MRGRNTYATTFTKNGKRAYTRRGGVCAGYRIYTVFPRSNAAATIYFLLLKLAAIIRGRRQSVVHGTAASIQRKHADTASRRGKWALIRICGDNSRAATIKLRYVKLAVTIFECGDYSRAASDRGNTVCTITVSDCMRNKIMWY